MITREELSSSLRDHLDNVDRQLEQIVDKYDYIDSRDFNGDLQSAINKACETSKELYIYGTYNVNQELVINSPLTIKFIGDSKITAVSEIENMFVFSKQVKLFNAQLNANNLANNIINITNELCEIYNSSLKNAKKDNIITSSTTIGNMIIENCDFSYGERGVILYGDKNSTVKFINNKIANVTGLLYYFERHKIVEIVGGDYTGGEASSVNGGYNCDEVYIDGGIYHDMYRGATLGMNVYKGYVKNVTCKSCSYAGISIDTKKSDGSFPDSQIIVTNNICDNCGISIRLASKGTILDGNTSINHNSSHSYYVNSGSAVIGKNSCIGGQSVYMFNNAEIKFGANITEGTATVQTSGTTVAIEKIIQKISSADNINSTSDIILCDTSSGGYAIKLPRYCKIIGKIIKIVKSDNTSNTLDINTLDSTTINGNSKISLNVAYSSVEITWDGIEWKTI